jgi:hypothetical protein
MPWIPELFTAPALEHVLENQRRNGLSTVPYFDGLLAGEPQPLVESFAGEPRLYDPLRGRVEGARAFTAYVERTRAWLLERNVSVENVEHVAVEGRGFGEVVLHLDGKSGRVALPYAVVADRRPDWSIEELRLYRSSWPLTGGHLNRPPLLQPGDDLREPPVVAEYQRALAAGDAGAVLATFEQDGYAREPAGGESTHRGPDGLRAFYEGLFANGGGIPLEHCAIADDGRACALEYNVVRWGETPLAPQAGVAVYVRGPSGRLAAARIYDDVDPPLARR